eukprot:scaffold135150_cov42-Prasinocladus_malaysianus.AAC.1
MLVAHVACRRPQPMARPRSPAAAAQDELEKHRAVCDVTAAYMPTGGELQAAGIVHSNRPS